METLSFTPKAIDEIKRLQSADPEASQAALRVMVTGGGCSGMSYKLGFDNRPPAETDKLIEVSGIKIIVDAKSSLFLKGTELDYSDGLNGKGFIFNNPNAKKTCGCGNSFSA